MHRFEALVDASTMKLAAGVGSAGSAVASWWAADYSVAIFGVPLSVLLMAAAGAAGVLSFLPAMPIQRALGTVFFCTTAGSIAAPVAERSIGWLAQGAPFAALAIAALLQIVLPWVLENRTRLADALLGMLPARRKGNGDGGAP